MSFLSKAGMSVSQSGFAGWEVELGLGDDERTRTATDRGAWRGAAWPAHHHLGRHGAGAERTAGASAAAALARVWRRPPDPPSPRPAGEQPDQGCRAGARDRARAHELS